MKTTMNRLLRRLAIVAMGLALAACASVSSTGGSPTLASTDTIAVLPIVNYTETPQAGLRAEAIVESLLKSGGVNNLKRYPANISQETLFEPAERQAVTRALEWARTERARYALTGSVQEWRYKVGVDGEPAVGVTLQLIDVQTGNVVWTSTGNRTGWSRSSVSGVAQSLLQQMLSPLTRG
jgi:TolB-like protein